MDLRFGERNVSLDKNAFRSIDIQLSDNCPIYIMKSERLSVCIKIKIIIMKGEYTHGYQPDCIDVTAAADGLYQ